MRETEMDAGDPGRDVSCHRLLSPSPISWLLLAQSYRFEQVPMPTMSFFLRFILIAALAAGLSACATNNPPAELHPEQFLSSGSYVQSYPGAPERSCEAARRALLSQGYVINESTASQVRGRKYFQPQAEIHTQIEFHVVCAANSEGSNSTTVFANAVRDRYSLRKSSNSASLGVGAIGSISLPFGSSDDALVKVGTETIPSKQFYGQFFDLIERYLDPLALPVDPS